MQKITPFLWFDDNAEAAIQFYTSVFKNAKILNTKRTGDNGKLSPRSDLTSNPDAPGQGGSSQILEGRIVAQNHTLSTWISDGSTWTSVTRWHT